MNVFAPLLINLIAGILVWNISVKKQNVNAVDTLWGLMFWFAALYWFFQLPEPSLKSWLILTLVTLWGLRLSIYLAHRNWGKPEDHRYQTIRANNSGFWWKSLYIIFGFQALLAWVASFGIFGALSVNGAINGPLTWLDALGLLVWLVGFVFEVVGDYQLSCFKKRASAGEVMRRGLWRYTRHPNYFGEFCIWWGIFLMAIPSGMWWTILSPLLMTFLLMKFSGVTLLESTISERRPRYRHYIERTNAFFPWFPKRQPAADVTRSQSSADGGG